MGGTDEAGVCAAGDGDDADSPPLRPYLWMMCGSVSFALMATLAHAVGDRCDWQAIAIVRTGVALFFAAALALFGRARLVFWRPRTLWVRSLAGSFSLVGTFYAYTRLPVSDVLAVTNVYPVWVALLSWLVLRERPTWRLGLSVLSGVAGVALIQQPHLAEGNFATLVALGCSVSTAFAMLGLHRLHGVDPRAVVAHFSGVSLVFAVAALFTFGRHAEPWALLDGRVALLLLGVGTTATAGQLWLTRAFAAGSPSRVSVVGLTQVVFALLLDWLFWGHPMDGQKLLGMGLVLAPTAWLMVRPPRSYSSRPGSPGRGAGGEPNPP